MSYDEVVARRQRSDTWIFEFVDIKNTQGNARKHYLQLSKSGLNDIAVNKK